MKAKVGQFCRHYKNAEQYLILALAYHTETGEEMVVYEAQYDTEDLGPKPIFVRPKAMFEEKVMHGGCMVERFQKLS